MHPAETYSELNPLSQPDLVATFTLTGTHFRVVPPGWSYPRHDHPYFELCWVESGTQSTRLTGHALEQGPGDLLLLCPFDAHGSTSSTGAALYCLHFDVDEMALRRLLCRAGSMLFKADHPLTAQLIGPIQTLRHHAAANDAGGLVTRLTLTASLFHLFAALAEVLLAEDGLLSDLPQTTLQTATRLAEAIERAVNQGDAHFSIESAIRQLGYHPDYGNTLFRQSYGLSARQYRATLRLRRAKMLLLDNELSIGHVAQRLGFSDGMRFSRQFKRWVGISPRQFRTSVTPFSQAMISTPRTEDLTQSAGT